MDATSLEIDQTASAIASNGPLTNEPADVRRFRRQIHK